MELDQLQITAQHIMVKFRKTPRFSSISNDDFAINELLSLTTIQGTLGGDAALEGGCAWLDTVDGRFEIRYPEGYQIVFGPLRLLDSNDEVIASEGDTVHVRGQIAENYVSICQVGPVFYATSVSSEIITSPTVLEPALIPTSNPFKPIELDIHYDSVSRLLYLYFSSPITQAGVTYQFVIDGIHSPIGTHMGTYTAYFALEQKGEEPPDNEPVHIIQADSSVPSAPEPVEPVEVTDLSIVRSAFISSETLSPPNQGFFIKKSDPANNDLFIDSDHNNGRITITFTERPALQYITNAYIKLQRKKLATPGRWEDLPADIHLDSDFPVVYVDSPSLESAPQYNQPGPDYFADNYKYRVRLLKDIAMYPPVASE